MSWIPSSGNNFRTVRFYFNKRLKRIDCIDEIMAPLFDEKDKQVQVFINELVSARLLLPGQDPLE